VNDSVVYSVNINVERSQAFIGKRPVILIFGHLLFCFLQFIRFMLLEQISSTYDDDIILLANVVNS